MTDGDTRELHGLQSVIAMRNAFVRRRLAPNNRGRQSRIRFSRWTKDSSIIAIVV